MYTSFYIAENRLDELKSFIKTFTPTVRFKHNPLKEGNKWFIELTMEVEDSNKLNELFNKWYNEDNPPKSSNKSIWKRMLRFWQYFVIYCFNFQIHFFDLWLNRYMNIGFAVLTFDNMERDRSLFAVFYQPQDRRIWLSICFINFRWYL